MKVFINGAMGYVGRKFLKDMSVKYQITACDVVLPNELNVSNFVLSPTLSNQSWADILAGHDAVIHLVQYPHYKDFPEKAEDMFQTNTALTLKLLEASRLVGIKIFILFSSGGIYGYGNEKFHELDKLNPLDFYLVTKAMSELIARKYRQFFSVHIVRPFFIYGPEQKGRLIVNLIDNIINKKAVFINGSGDGGKINPIYIDDVISIIDRLLEINPGNATVNLAGPDIVSIEEIIRMISEITGIEAKIERKINSPTNNIIADISRIQEISYYKLTHFSDGLKKTVNSFLK